MPQFVIIDKPYRFKIGPLTPHCEVRPRYAQFMHTLSTIALLFNNSAPTYTSHMFGTVYADSHVSRL